MTEHFDTIIVGGGLSGLTIAHTLKTLTSGHRILLIEKSIRTGGAISTHRDQGYIAEIGPHGFLDNCPESQQLLAQTGLDSEAVRAPLKNFVRYVCLDGKLCCIPQSPGKILMAPLIPWKAKLRVLADLWIRPLEGEPTVAKWIAHRFGPALLPFADAVFTGTYAGDYNELSIDSVMPGIRQLEKNKGSVIRGLVQKMWQAKQSGAKRKLTMPAMTSFPTGMHRLAERLTEGLTPETELLLGCGVTALSRSNTGWEVTSDQGTHFTKNLVLALPVNSSLPLLGAVSPIPPVSSIPEAWIATVVFGFGPSAVLPPGFGYLVPEQEGRFTLGTLFSSNMFPGRAPTGHIVFETLVGGRRHPERLALDDTMLTRLALEDVRQILNLPGEPLYSTVLRPASGIPQLERGYGRLLDWRNQLMRENRSLYICGFGWEGIGINDMIKSAVKVAESILSDSGSPNRQPEIKGVYF
jgi:oxygen-dependent protoporphyrinogen oxidase